MEFHSFWRPTGNFCHLLVAVDEENKFPQKRAFFTAKLCRAKRSDFTALVLVMDGLGDIMCSLKVPLMT